MSRKKQNAFTNLEVLMVVSMTAVLMSAGLIGFQGMRKTLDLESAANQLSQEIQGSRSFATSRGKSRRVRVTTSGQFVVEENSGTGTWINRGTFSLPSGVVFSNSTNDSITFDTRAFASFSTGFSISTPISQFTLTGNGKTIGVQPTLAGAVRLVKP